MRSCSFAVALNGDSCATVMAVGEIDVASSSDLLACLEQALTEADDVRLDLDGVTFIDSTGVSVLLQVKVHAERLRRTMRVVAASPAVVATFDRVQLRDYLLT